MPDKEQQMGRVLEAIKNLHEDVRDIRKEQKCGFEKVTGRVRTLEVQHGKFKAVATIIGSVVLILIAALVKVFLS